ncbi:hypothetical protein TorRG33x02_347790 [Trema orientale]|uniref:Uncharacterized protein n=1 Tax=Trema orientale TaxID=63057 RepID=A0A2P5AL18_TREOI|nr:hypothetical protein TorRG33x02_347790 [Trema orientale]
MCIKTIQKRSIVSELQRISNIPIRPPKSADNTPMNAVMPVEVYNRPVVVLTSNITNGHVLQVSRNGNTSNKELLSTSLPPNNQKANENYKLTQRILILHHKCHEQKIQSREFLFLKINKNKQEFYKLHRKINTWFFFILTLKTLSSYQGLSRLPKKLFFSIFGENLIILVKIS